jgi:hypothetical protein
MIDPLDLLGKLLGERLSVQQDRQHFLPNCRSIPHCSNDWCGHFVVVSHNVGDSAGLLFEDRVINFESLPSFLDLCHLGTLDSIRSAPSIFIGPFKWKFLYFHEYLRFSREDRVHPLKRDPNLFV